PAVMQPCYEAVVPALLGGELAELPPQMPSHLPAPVAGQVAAVLAGERKERKERKERSVPVAGSPAPYVIDEVACRRLRGFLPQIPDQRDQRGVRYPLPYLLALPIVASMAHQRHLNAIAEWVAEAPEDLLLALGAPTDTAGAARRPDAKTIVEALAAHAAD